MDSNGLLLETGLASLAIRGSVSCFNHRKKLKNLCKIKLSSLILSKGTGKTMLKEHLQSLSSDLIIVDMNEAITDSKDELDFLKKGQEYIDDLLKRFSKKRFLLLIENREQSTFFRVSEESSFVVTPCISLLNTILKDLSLSKKLEVEKARLALIKDTSSDKLNIFESYNELYSILKQLYKLQSTF